MAFARARAARTLQSSLRRSVPRVSAPGRTLAQRRWASDGGHGHAEAGSDLPWALAGVAITIPSCWYLWPDSSHADAGHHGHDEEHEEEEKGEEAAEEEPKEVEPKDEESGPVEDAKPDNEKEQKKEEQADDKKVEAAEEKEEDKKEEEKDEKKDEKKEEKKDEKTDENASEAAADDSEGGEEKKQSKGKTVRKTLPSSGQPLGKDGGEGKTNTAAKHSMPIGDSPEKSKKPEGGPETARATGTVAVKRHD